MKIQPVSYDLDPLWLHEFIGLFCGEGHVLLGQHNHRSHFDLVKGSTDYVMQVIVPELRMDLHPRETPVLRDIQLRLGGSLKWYDNADSNYGRFRWLLSGWSRVGPLAQLMVQSAYLPMPKIDELRVLVDLFQFRLACGSRMTQDQKDHLQVVRQQLMTMRNDFEIDVSGFQSSGGKTASDLPLTVRAKKLQHSFP